MTLTHPAGATPEAARALTDRIKVALDGTWELIKQAYQVRAWDVLGYTSWDDYCTREFGTSRLRLPMEERREVVASLRDSGMSTRAIASATGVARNTVKSDIREVGQIDPPDPEPLVAAEAVGTPEPLDQEEAVPIAKVVGIDGKTYNPQPAPKRVKRPPLPTQFSRFSDDLSKVIARAERLHADDRFKTNKPAISDASARSIRRAIEMLQGLLDDLGEAAQDYDGTQTGSGS